MSEAVTFPGRRVRTIRPDVQQPAQGRWTMDRATPTGRAPKLAWIALVAGFVAIGLEVASAAATQGATFENAVLLVGLLVVAGAFLISGVLIATRRPGNIVGWLLILPGLAVPIGSLAGDRIAAIDPAPTAASPALWLG